MELCEVCKKNSEDLRQLCLQYLYDLSEISGKLRRRDGIIRFADGRKVTDVFWTIQTCKDCRGDFLGILQRWTNGEFSK